MFELVALELERTHKTKEETVKRFKQLAFEYERYSYRNDDKIANGKAEAYELAAFQIERNMK
ncbi:hypothetical protein NQ830_12530 [Clostridioides difficile]|uniref:hypothetical protein n=1 Tax=Clostridioides difficile TaxID=1496 RepID=UPI00038D8C5A|nr:hypothetical protein [Clostridioides difficile]EQJ88601.1 hypothetical protein QUC_3376 [Clostridioides difficile P50]MCR1410159.1 hypothetical protein [Clostridioides difficile]MCR1421147.1 hypothetical protein [Clostridioides difficile]MDI0326504.1 hypothetical protein [Clostridioides difficile]MDI6183093.1 hypothetical protein [Clostridioides difficile]